MSNKFKYELVQLISRKTMNKFELYSHTNALTHKLITHTHTHTNNTHTHTHS